MTEDALRTARMGGCLLLLSCAIACGGAPTNPALSAGQPATPEAERAAQPALVSPPEGPPTAEPAPEASHAQAPRVGPQDSPFAQEKKLAPGSKSNSDLRAATDAFDQALGANSLSCDGARPHRDAICEIARRLCELSVKTPSSGSDPDDCVTASQACEKAQRKYQARCGK